MKTVLPQGTGAIEWGGVPLALMIAIGLVILFSFAILGYDCWRAINRRPPSTRKDCADEDQFLDALAMEVDRQLEERTRRQPRPAGVTAT